MPKLLPANADLFRSKAYWDNFFKQRENEAFEWYGSYKDVSHFIAQHIPDNKSSVLTIGCGNSEFSHNMYDSGYRNIRNLDYSSVVINEMILKNANNKRPGMFWDLGDMTQMNYKDGQFSAVCDKGALDALMSVDTAEVRAKAKDMFSEVTRVLQTGGKYICITLAEPFILGSLMSYFVDPTISSLDHPQRWMIQAETFTPSQASPFCPICLIFTKLRSVSGQTANAAVSPILCRIDAAGRSTLKPERMTPSSFCQRIQSAQEFTKGSVGISEIQPGRFDEFQLWNDEDDGQAKSEETKNTSEINVTSDTLRNIPRFTLTVLDASNVPSDSNRIACAVFLIPQGKSAHFQFCTQRGLEGIAELANCRRLIAVRCNRPHTFPKSQSLLQAELDPMVRPLLPVLYSGTYDSEKVPYVAIPDEGGWELVAEGVSTISGAYIVEESDPDSKSNTEETSVSYLVRRLVFLGSQHFVQTEMRFTVASSPATPVNSADKGVDSEAIRRQRAHDDHVNALCVKHGWSLDHLAGLQFDCTYADDHHRAVLVGLALRAEASTNLQRNLQAIIIGLGGGAFPMLLQHCAPQMTQFAVDLDPEMLEIAVRHFGYRPLPTSKFLPCDGAEVLREARAQICNGNTNTNTGATQTAKTNLFPTSHVDLIFIDVDGKEEVNGISAPPEAFTRQGCIEDCWHLLAPGGILAINVVARAEDSLKSFKNMLCKVFSTASAKAASELNKESDIRDLIRGAISGTTDLHLDSDACALDSHIDIDIDDDNDDIGSGIAAVRANTSSEPSALTHTGTVFRLKAGEEVVNQTFLCIKGAAVAPTEREKVLQSWCKLGNLANGTNPSIVEPLELIPLLSLLEEI